MPADDAGRATTAIRRRDPGHEALVAAGRIRGGIIQVVVGAEPCHRPARLLGTLSVGFSLDERWPRQFKALTNSEIAFGVGGTDPGLDAAARGFAPGSLAASSASVGVGRSGRRRRVRRGQPHAGPEPDAARRPPIATAGASDRAHPALAHRAAALPERRSHASLLGDRGARRARGHAPQLRASRGPSRGRSARSPTSMREMAATGDLTRKIALRHGSRWDDEDARLLATTFNTLTDSIARFQREMSQKRAAVVARPAVDRHRARDPQPADDHQGGAARAAAARAGAAGRSREAVADIDEEVARLNRHRQRGARLRAADPFELAPVDLNALCRESAAAARRPDRAPAGRRCDLDPALGAGRRPTPSGCASRSSTSWSTRATRCTATATAPPGADRADPR